MTDKDSFYPHFKNFLKGLIYFHQMFDNKMGFIFDICMHITSFFTFALPRLILVVQIRFGNSKHKFGNAETQRSC